MPGERDLWEAQVDLPWDVALEYKYTRGSWATVEKSADGGERENRSLFIDRVQTVQDEVEAWADPLP